MDATIALGQGAGDEDGHRVAIHDRGGLIGPIGSPLHDTGHHAGVDLVMGPVVGEDVGEEDVNVEGVQLGAVWVSGEREPPILRAHDGIGVGHP